MDCDDEITELYAEKPAATPADWRARRLKRTRVMIDRIADKLMELGLHPSALIPESTKEWKWDGEKIRYRCHEGTIDPRISELLGYVQKYLDE